MNRIRIPLMFMIVLVLCACSPQAVSGGAPQAWIDDPLDGMRLSLQPYTIAFHSSDSTGISRMEVSVNGAILATLPNPDPAQLLVYLTQVWEPQKPGRYVIRVRAQNAAGTWSEGDLVTVEVEESTPTPEITVTPTATATSTPTLSPRIGFLGDPVFTPARINLPYDCMTSSITAEQRVLSTQGIQGVMLFYRLTDNAFSVWSDWVNITMNPASTNSYRIQFDPILLGDFKPWLSAHVTSADWTGWVQTQFVIQEAGNALTRSPVQSLVKIGGCS